MRGDEGRKRTSLHAIKKPPKARTGVWRREESLLYDPAGGLSYTRYTTKNRKEREKKGEYSKRDKKRSSSDKRHPRA